MAKTKLPLFSQSASGTFAKTITFQNRAGEHAAHLRIKRAENPSQKQLYNRYVMAECRKAWGGLSSVQKDAWQKSAVSQGYPSGYHHFMQSYLEQVHRIGNCKCFPQG